MSFDPWYATRFPPLENVFEFRPITSHYKIVLLRVLNKTFTLMSSIFLRLMPLILLLTVKMFKALRQTACTAALPKEKIEETPTLSFWEGGCDLQLMHLTAKVLAGSSDNG